MIILVCGGRDYSDNSFVFQILDRVHRKYGITKIVHGGASGADTIADVWAVLAQVENKAYPVTKEEWKILGRKAGPLRNQKMLDNEAVDAIIAFPGGSGTQDMINRGLRAGIGVWQPTITKD